MQPLRPSSRSHGLVSQARVVKQFRTGSCHSSECRVRHYVTRPRPLSLHPTCHPPVSISVRIRCKRSTGQRVSEGTLLSKDSKSIHAYSTTPSRNQSPFFVELPHRALLAVGGRDASRFLQGLTTNNVPFNITKADDQSQDLPLALSSAFLSPQGRLLQDVLIYTLPGSAPCLQSLSLESTDEGVAYLIEVDRSQVLSLMKTLKRYKLRSKVSMKEIPAEHLRIAFRSVGDSGSSATIEKVTKDHQLVYARDERAPNFGYRIIAPPDQLRAGIGGEEAPLNAYRLHRYRNGIAEGQDELPSEHALVHDSDLDLMRGVDFRKGCYVGQELVIRTQHTGVVRKRILPAVLYQAGEVAPEALPSSLDTSTFPAIPYGTDIRRTGETDAAGRKIRSAGRWVANVGDIGLALVRLEVMAGLGPTGEQIDGWQAPEFAVDVGKDYKANPRVKVFVPPWWAERLKN